MLYTLEIKIGTKNDEFEVAHPAAEPVMLGAYSRWRNQRIKYRGTDYDPPPVFDRSNAEYTEGKRRDRGEDSGKNLTEMVQTSVQSEACEVRSGGKN
jgi:hypothetical protein